MNLKQLLLTGSVVAVCLGGVNSNRVKAEIKTTVSATIASEYIFRGFESSQGDPALQGNFGFSHDSGFSGGIWGSTYDYGGGEDGVEVDLFAAYGFSLDEDWTLSIGFTEYTYSGDSNATTEFNIGLAYQNFSLTYYDDVDLDTVYINFAASFKVTDNGNVLVNAANRNPDVGESNNDFSVGYNHSFTDKFSGFLTYITNDLDVPGAEDYLVGSVTYSF